MGLRELEAIYGKQYGDVATRALVRDVFDEMDLSAPMWAEILKRLRTRNEFLPREGIIHKVALDVKKEMEKDFRPAVPCDRCNGHGILWTRPHFWKVFRGVAGCGCENTPSGKISTVYESIVAGASRLEDWENMEKEPLEGKVGENESLWKFHRANPHRQDPRKKVEEWEKRRAEKEIAAKMEKERERQARMDQAKKEVSDFQPGGRSCGLQRSEDVRARAFRDDPKGAIAEAEYSAEKRGLGDEGESPNAEITNMCPGCGRTYPTIDEAMACECEPEGEEAPF
jgi:hypothetical protein